MTHSFLPRLTAFVVGCVCFALTPHLNAAYISIEGPQNPALPRQYAPGSSITFRVTSSPLPAGQYQWFHDGKPIAGATAPTLVLASLSATDSGNYEVRITNNGMVDPSDTFTLNVLPPPPSPVDKSFKNQTSVYLALPIAFTRDGGMVVTTATGPQRLRPDGSVDGSFNFPASAGRVLALFPDDRMIVSEIPFRLSADGTPDPLALPAGFDPTKPLSSAAVQPDGRFLIAQDTKLARLNADGSLDAGFDYSGVSYVTTLDRFQFDLQGRIYVSATAHATNPTNWPQEWYTMFRLTSSGAYDPSFRVWSSTHAGENRELFFLNDGRILSQDYGHLNHFDMLRDDGAMDPTWKDSSHFVITEVPAAVDPTGRLFAITFTGGISRYTITATGLALDPTFYSGDGQAGSLTLAPDGKLLVTGGFKQWDGFASLDLIRLRSTDFVTLPPMPQLDHDPSPSRGDTWRIDSDVTGTGPFTYQWLALDSQPLPIDTRSSQLVIPNFSAANVGRYQLRVTGPGGVSVLSSVAAPRLGADIPYLANLSGRAMTGTGEDTVIAGLVTQPPSPWDMSALVRGVGPALRPFGLTHFLSDPAIDVFNSAGQLIANDDQWWVNPDVTAAANTAGAFSFAADSDDAALVHRFPAGSATVMLKRQAGADGIGLLEIYQLPDPLGAQRQHLLNLSFRARTAPGDGTAIAGFLLADPTGLNHPAKVLVRAIGPTLAQSGIAHPLENPVLTVYNSKGEVVAQNDDWPSHLTTEVTEYDQASAKVGAFPLPYGSKDAGLLLDLPAGAYTMQASGGSGVVLLEIYLVH